MFRVAGAGPGWPCQGGAEGLCLTRGGEYGSPHSGS